jgi:hypothetical protein
MNKSESLFRKIKTVGTHGISDIKEGRDNYNLNNPKIEDDAAARAKVCKGCSNYEAEPIDFLKREDARIPELDNMMCGGETGCGCALAYLARQYSKVCKKWK